MSDVAVLGIGEAVGQPERQPRDPDLPQRAAALDEAGLTRNDLDGVVLAASDQTTAARSARC